MIQPQLRFDLDQGEALRDEGMAMAALTQSELLAEARDEAVRIARAQGYVTIDDVRRAAHVPPGTTNGQNWIGSVFKDKRFVWTGRMKKSEIPSNHGRMIRVWSLRGQ